MYIFLSHTKRLGKHAAERAESARVWYCVRACVRVRVCMCVSMIESARVRTCVRENKCECVHVCERESSEGRQNERARHGNLLLHLYDLQRLRERE